jgi:hypothetical protein
LDVAVDRRLIERNPARKLRAKSRKRPSKQAHTLEECGLLLAQVSGADHVVIRLLMQLGLRAEELFALRKNDIRASELVIDEAIVDGETKEPKTLASAGVMYVPPDLELELVHYTQTIDGAPDAWLFPSTRCSRTGRPCFATCVSFLPTMPPCAAGRKSPKPTAVRKPMFSARACPFGVEKVLREYLRLGENRVRVDTVVKAAGLDYGARGRTCGHQIIHDLWARGVLEDRRIAYRPTYRIRPDLVSDIEHILAAWVTSCLENVKIPKPP